MASIVVGPSSEGARARGGGGVTRAAERLVSLAAIVDLDVRVGAVGERFRRAGVAAFASDLDALLAQPPSAGGGEADALLACAIWLLNGGERHLPALDAVAVERGLGALHAVLADGAAHRSLARGGRLPDVGLFESARIERHVAYRSVDTGAFDELSVTRAEQHALGTREYFELLGVACDRHQERMRGRADLPRSERPPVTLTRLAVSPRGVRAQIARLGRHPSAFTIGRLLREREVRLADVVGIAARRPTTAALVRELTSHLGWVAHPNVRAAIVANPYTPLRVALILAVTCRGRLERMAEGVVHPRVRALRRGASTSVG
jgi:hypothetical protein